jgi:hypothetical protein
MLTVLLTTVCLVPVLTIAYLWAVLPPVKENQLPAEVTLAHAPASDYYQQDFGQRRFQANLSVVVKNVGKEPWTNINVRINRRFNVYEHKYPINPGEDRSFLVSRFLERGVLFDMRYAPVSEVLVMARLSDGSRATYVKKLEP